jgi:hypothetical protein
VNTLQVLDSRPSSRLDPAPADAELSLAALLELFAPDGSDAPTRRSLRSSVARLCASVQLLSRRAAEWGAVPGRAASHTSLTGAE